MNRADRSAFGLPHFPVRTKEEKSRYIIAKLAGLLLHNIVSQLSLFTMTVEMEKGAIHVIKTIQRSLNNRLKQEDLPPTLFV